MSCLFHYLVDVTSLPPSTNLTTSHDRQQTRTTEFVHIEFFSQFRISSLDFRFTIFLFVTSGFSDHLKCIAF